MEPRVTKRDKKVHLSYELPHRIHCSRTYPIPAPNGSTVVIYGHERGIKVLWRGGRRTTSPHQQTNGISKAQDIIVIDDSDDERGDVSKRRSIDDYEDEEEEEDPDCPHASIVHDLDLALESSVLHLAIPSIPTSQAPKLSKTHAFVAIACANGTSKLLSIPLKPPKDNEDSPNGLSQVDLPALSHPARSLTAAIVPVEEEAPAQTRSKSRGPKVEAEILIAAVSSMLDVYTVDVTPTAIKARRTPSICSVTLGSHASSVSFHPSSRGTRLLVSETAGAVRLYDPFALELPNGQFSGKWLMSYSAPYEQPSSSSPSPARRKRVLDCAWVLNGRGILALLEDGEWGIWDILGSAQSGKLAEEFTISGYLGTASEAAEPARSKKPSKLAPMTPNTRKTKSESLFSFSSKVAGAASTGGICAAPIPSKSGPIDDSVVMWYGDYVYSVPSMQQFLQRSASNSGGFGSLYAPGMTHLSDINLQNESITSISQLSDNAQTSSVGQMSSQRDLVISAEHRLIITQTVRPLMPSRQLFQQAAERPVPHDRDQRMLDAGDLDLGGLNRMLDNRAEDTRPRRVGFAH